MMKANKGLIVVAVGLVAGFTLALTGCSGGSSSASSTPSVNCSNPQNWSLPACNRPNGAGGPGTGVFYMGVPRDGSVVINLRGNQNSAAHWALENGLCTRAGDGAVVPFDCIQISNAVFSFHIDMDDNSDYYGGRWGQQTSIGQARWRIRMTDAFGRPAISTVFEGRAVKIGNGFQIQSGSTLISGVYSGGMGAMTVTISYHARGGAMFTLGSGTMRGI